MGRGAQAMLRCRLDLPFPTSPAGADVDSSYAWLRLTVAVVLGSIGTVGMWSIPVVLPTVQVDFSVARADASLPFMLTMFGFALGGIALGRLSDRLGIAIPLLCGIASLGVGYVGAGLPPTLWLFALPPVGVGFRARSAFSPPVGALSQMVPPRPRLAGRGVS